MIGFFIKKAFFDGWDNLLTIALFNLGYVVIIVALLASPMAVPGSASAAIFLVLLCVFLFYFYTGGVAMFLGEITYDRRPEFRDFFSYCLETWKTSITLAVITSIQLIVLIVGFPFYLSMGGVLATGALSILFWVSVLWWLISLWVYPVSIQLESSVKLQLKKSLFLFLDNTGFTLFLAFYSLLNFFLSLITAFLVPGFTGIHYSRQIALKLRLYKYDYLEENPKIPSKNVPWETLLAEEKEKMGKRTAMGMLFPWKD
ncbi:MAG: hypothetical protein R6V67_05620 [Spirochaetia bacterium]